MLNSISVTTVLAHQVEAARAVSMRLDAEGVKHVFIGGFACAVLGKTAGRNIVELHDKMVRLDERLMSSNMKLYFVRKIPPSPSSSHPTQDDAAEDIVKNSRGNVLVETVAAGTLGLPTIAGPVYHDDNSDLKILHPSVLPLTKLSRWASLRGSTRPESLIRCRKDALDITLLIGFLGDLDLKLGIADYEGKSRAKMLLLVSTFYNSCKDDKEFCAMLQKVMKSEDWEDMLKTPLLEVESEIMPPDFRKRRVGEQKGKARSRAA